MFYGNAEKLLAWSIKTINCTLTNGPTFSSIAKYFAVLSDTKMVRVCSSAKHDRRYNRKSWAEWQRAQDPHHFAVRWLHQREHPSVACQTVSNPSAPEQSRSLSWNKTSMTFCLNTLPTKGTRQTIVWGKAWCAQEMGLALRWFSCQGEHSKNNSYCCTLKIHCR